MIVIAVLITMSNAQIANRKDKRKRGVGISNGVTTPAEYHNIETHFD